MKNFSVLSASGKAFRALRAFDKIWRKQFGEYSSIYLVGGSVPGILTGVIPNDFDIASSKEPATVVSTFEKHEQVDVLPTGIDYGTVTIRFFFEEQTFSFEHTTFRKDIAYTPTGRSPIVEFDSSIYNDLERRDFTVNAIGYNLYHSHFVDPTGGLTDLERGILRWVGDPVQRITEDPLRIMRLYITREKYGLEYERSIDPQTFQSYRKTFLLKVSAERVYQHLQKIFSSFRPRGIQNVLNSIQRDCPWILYSPGAETQFTDGFEGLPESISVNPEDIPYLSELYITLYLNKVFPFLREDIIPVIPGSYYRNDARIKQVQEANLWELKQIYTKDRYLRGVLPLGLVAQLTGRTEDLKSYRVNLENPAFEGYEVTKIFPSSEDAPKRGQWLAEVGQAQMVRPEGESIADFKIRIKEEYKIE